MCGGGGDGGGGFGGDCVVVEVMVVVMTETNSVNARWVGEKGAGAWEASHSTEIRESREHV